MSRPASTLRDRSSPPVMALLEEGFHLLRGLPLVAWTIYLATLLPFAWLFLFFWLTMIHQAGSERALGEWSFLLAGAAVLLRGGQSWFFQALLARRAGQPLPRWSLSRTTRVVLEQAGWLGLAVLVLPVALLATLPFPYVYSFFQYVMAVSGGTGQGAGGELREAARMARQQGRRDWVMLGVLVLFAAVVFVNWMTCFQALPALLKSFFGIETVFSRSALGAVYAVLVPVALVFTAIVVDPMLKAAYALRWFYLRAAGTGEDLRVALRALPPLRSSVGGARPGGSLLLVFVALAVGAGTPFSSAAADGAEPASASPGVAVGPQAPGEADRSDDTLNRRAERFGEAAERVLERKRYAWRLPPPEGHEASPSSPGLISRFFRWLGDLFGGAGERDGTRNGGSGPGSGSPGAWFPVLLLGLLFLAVILLAALLFRAFRALPPPAHAEAAASETEPEPDVEHDLAAAADRPVSEWILLARRCHEEGDLRRAVRAYFLAQLAELAGRGVLRLARFKSNRDYERELRMRAVHLGGLPDAFAENVALFERSWYGTAPVDEHVLERFETNLKTMEVAV